MSFKNIGENMAEMTEADIKALKEIISTYKTLLNRGTARTPEELQKIADEPLVQISKKFRLVGRHKKSRRRSSKTSPTILT
ncbi:hypothetical protein LJK87_01100 [Paenibacillus sp. P25]|nr:hypothetical protein LJK87_01100 [Paenibacillus sp. P25]